MGIIMHCREPLKSPSVVLCDLDNTFYEYAPADRFAMTAVRNKAQQLLGLGPLDFQRAFEEAKGDVKSRLGNTASSHSRLLYFQRMIEIVGMKTQILVSLDLEQTYWRTFLTQAKILPGVKEFLEELRLLGIPTAVVTDLTAQIQFRKLIYFQLDGYFDYIVTSEEAGADKPSPAPFRLALEKFGYPKGPVWMIGDHAQNDIEGAKSAVGAVTFQIRRVDGEQHSCGAPDVHFDNFLSLLRLLRSVNGVDRSAQAG